MKLRAVIAHCWTGTPGVGWYPQARTALQRLGIDTALPQLPETDEPVLEHWLETLSAAIGERSDDLLLIGHSLGALAALHWLANAKQGTSIAGLLLVAPPLSPIGIAQVDRFLTPAPDLCTVRLRATRIDALFSIADPYLKPDPSQVALLLRTELGATNLIVSDRGHFAPSSGQSPVPELREWAKGFVRTPLPGTTGA